MNHNLSGECISQRATENCGHLGYQLYEIASFKKHSEQYWTRASKLAPCR